METKKIKLKPHHTKEMWRCIEVFKDLNEIRIYDLDKGFDYSEDKSLLIPYDYAYRNILEVALAHFQKIGLNIKSYYWNANRERYLFFTNDQIISYLLSTQLLSFSSIVNSFILGLL